MTLGCGGSTPPPKPPPDEPEPAPKAMEEPAAPPCSTLADRCEADSETRAPVPGTDLVFAPPESWLYAAEPEVTLAQTPDGGPCLAIASYELTGDVETNRIAALELLMRSVALEIPGDDEAPPVDWAKPDATEDVGSISLQLWQKEGGSRASNAGPVLIFRFEAGENRQAVGVGFVPADDKSEADAKIMDALSTVEEGMVVPPAVTAEEEPEE